MITRETIYLGLSGTDGSRQTICACFPNIIIDHSTFSVPVWVAHYIVTMALYLVIPDQEDIGQAGYDDNYRCQMSLFWTHRQDPGGT